MAMTVTAERDYYKILGVARNADATTLKRAYRNLVKKYHPDTNLGDKNAEAKFMEIREAYDVLGNEKKRILYDLSRRNDFGQEGFWQAGFRVMGQDLTDKLEISFEEAIFGVEKLIYYQYPDGSVRAMKVPIPAGIDTGKKIRLAGKGMPGMNGGDPGSLILEIWVGKKEGFERDGLDVHTTMQIPFPTAVFGGEVTVSTLYGDVRCRIQEGMQSGTRLRLRGKGIVSMQNPAIKGDQYVTIQIQVPQGLGPEAKQKLREYCAAVAVQVA